MVKLNIKISIRVYSKREMQGTNYFLEMYKQEPQEVQESIRQYIAEMGTLEKKACEIAKDHLGTSFHLLKSNGYIDWCKKKQSEKK
jgi:hypothetical protein